MMIKLYKRQPDGRLAYHETWVRGKHITEHWGQVGTQGESRVHPIQSGDERYELERILAMAREGGFERVDRDRHRRLVVEYVVAGMGTVADLDKRVRLENRLNETLGWTGLGHCDGGSIGSGTMEVCCFVVDFETAKSVVERDLTSTEFSNFSRIYDEDADGE